MTVEEKWQANREKVAFAKAFPGMASNWETLRGRIVEQVVPVGDHRGTLLIFSGGLFAVIPAGEQEPADLLLALQAGRPWLEPFHANAYRTLDELVARDRELQRKSRLEKLLSAVKNNYPNIPELKEELKKLLDELE
jgi:hypothetical protein